MFLSKAYFDSHSNIAKGPKQLRCEEDSQALLLINVVGPNWIDTCVSSSKAFSFVCKWVRFRA